MVAFERIDAGSTQHRPSDAAPARQLIDETAIAERVRAGCAIFSWATWLLRAPRREAMHALYAFCDEIDDVADGQASLALKATFFANWRAQIALLYAGQPQHAVTRALHDPVEKFDLRSSDFLAIIDGREMTSRSDIRAPSLEQLDLYCEQSAVAISRIALRILGASSPDGERLAAALGRGIQLTSILRDLAQGAAQRRVYLPRELLHAHGIFATIPSYVLAQPALPHVCDALAERAAAYFADAERAIRGRPRWTMLAATAILSSHRALLGALAARGWARLDEPVRVPAWHQPALLLWHLPD